MKIPYPSSKIVLLAWFLGQVATSGAVKFVGAHPLLLSFVAMALCGGLCITENSSTPRQGNAEDRADYASFLRLDLKTYKILKASLLLFLSCRAC